VLSTDSGFFLSSKQLPSDFENFSKGKLNTHLRTFYASVRKQDGELLKKTSLNVMKNGIAKYLKEKCDIDTKKDPEFSSSAAVFSAVVTDFKKKGLGGTEHKPVICREDLVELYSPSNIALNPDSPSGLLHKVWFDAMTYLYRRGRENLREMTRHTFTVAVDGSGRRFVAQVCTLSIEVFLVFFWFCTTFLKKKFTVVIIIFSIH